MTNTEQDQAKIDAVTHKLTGEFYVGQRVCLLRPNLLAIGTIVMINKFHWVKWSSMATPTAYVPRDLVPAPRHG